jgi:hypothetical protein
VDSAGNAVFAWLRTTYTDGTTRCDEGACAVQARARSASGALSNVQSISALGADAPELAVDSGGDAVFVWERPDGTTQCGGGPCIRAQTRARSASGTLSAAQVLSAPAQNARRPQVDVDSDGDAVFSWGAQCGDFLCASVQDRARSAAGALSSIQTLSTSGDHGLFTEVGVDSNGDAVFAWQRFDGTAQCGGISGCARIQARARSAAGALSQTQTLSAAGRHASNADLAVDSAGNAVFVWMRPDATTDCRQVAQVQPCYRIEAISRSAAGALSTVQILSAPGQNAYFPLVAVDPDGGADPNTADAVAVWERPDGTTDCTGNPCTRVQAAAQIAP